ncbi:MAG: double-stranded RNA binding motif domain-containing protein [Candidatus Heimdallarchaeota archaeon]
MNKNTLLEYFKLEKHPRLFDKALHPKSCGGGDEFKFMALRGDYLLKLCLLEILASKHKTQNTGHLTQLSMQFHNERTLMCLSDYLGIPQLMNPMDTKANIEINDKKEVIEALLDAVNQTNNMATCKAIVKKLYAKAQKLGLLDVDYISILQNDCRKKALANPVYEYTEEIGKESQKQMFQCTVKINLNTEPPLELTSDKYYKKQEAKIDAAHKACIELNIPLEPTQIVLQKAIEEKIYSVKQSIKSDKLIFEQKGAFDAVLKLTEYPNKTLLEYVREKYDDDPFEMLIKVSARIEDISGNIWSTGLDTETSNTKQELILLHMNLLGENHFEIALAESKTKAKRAAAKLFVRKSNFFEWINECYPDYKI